jgi:hypothetical protein
LPLVPYVTTPGELSAEVVAQVTATEVAVRSLRYGYLASAGLLAACAASGDVAVETAKAATAADTTAIRARTERTPHVRNTTVPSHCAARATRVPQWYQRAGKVNIVHRYERREEVVRVRLEICRVT